MCIICNSESGSDFLSDFENARKHISKSTETMLRCSQEATDPEVKKRYNRIHKKMVRLKRDWNKLEHEREKRISTE